MQEEVRKTVTVTKTTRVEIDRDRVIEILRKEFGAPATAMFEFETWGDVVLLWSTTEDTAE